MDDPNPREPNTDKELSELRQRVAFLESVVREQIARIFTLEERLGIPEPAQPAKRPAQPARQTGPPERGPAEPLAAGEPAKPSLPVEPQPTKATTPAQPPSSTLGSPERQTLGSAAGTVPSGGTVFGAQPVGPAQPARFHEDLEARIGGSWLNVIGIIAVTLGIAFFLKYAFDNQWIGPYGRVLMGTAAGIGFLIGGDRLRARGYHAYGSVLAGGGILILYLSVYAAFAFYELIAQRPAFVLMSVVTTLAVVLASRYDALPIALLGLIGGFMTPGLLSTGVDNQIGLFGYLALLVGGVLAIAFLKKWRILNYLAFVGTVLMFVGWMETHYEPPKLGLTIFFLTLFFAMFALVTVIYNLIKREPSLWLDLLLVILNAVFYFGASYGILEREYYGILGLFAVLVSAFYLGLGYVAYRRDAEDRLLLMVFIGLGVLFLVLAVPIQFDQQWITMGWAVQAVILAWIGLRIKDGTARKAALVVFFIAGARWVLYDASEWLFREPDRFIPLLNRRSLSGFVLIAALGLAIYLYRRLGEGVEDRESRLITGLYLLAANVVALAVLSLDVNEYYEHQRILARDPLSGVGPFARLDHLSASKQFMLSAVWTAYGAIALMVGIAKGIALLRAPALVLLGLTTFKILTVDAGYYDADWHVPLLNQTFAAFTLMILALACSVWFYARAEEVEDNERNVMIPALICAANVLAVIALSAEASGYYQRQVSEGMEYDAQRDLRLAEQLSLSLIWAVYGGVALVIGFLRGSKLLRVFALLLLLLTIVKVFFVDMSALDRLYRIISFIVLGAILLAVSFLYQRSRRRAAMLAAEEPPFQG